MMLGYRLLRLVETHSEALAAGLLEKTQQSPLLSGYRDVPPGELSNACTKSIGTWPNGFSVKASWMSRNAIWRSGQSGLTSTYR